MVHIYRRGKEPSILFHLVILNSLAPYLGMDHGPHILPHVAQELVCVMGMELPQ